MRAAVLSVLVVWAVWLGAASSAEPAEIATIGVAGAVLLADPDDNAPAIGRVDSGQRVVVLSIEGRWHQVEAWVRVAAGAMTRTDGWLRSDALVTGGAAKTVVVAPKTVVVVRGAQDRPETSTADPPPPVPGVLILDINGSPGLAYTADCEAVRDDGAVVRDTVEGLVPASLEFTAVALACRVTKEDVRGLLFAEIYRDEDLIAGAETLSPYNWVAVRTEGPWGAAAATEGDVRLIVPRRPSRIVLPPGSQRIPPALSGQSVPPLDNPRPFR